MKYTVSVNKNTSISIAASDPTRNDFVYEDRLLRETKESVLERLKDKGKSFSQADRFHMENRNEVYSWDQNQVIKQ